MVLKNNLLKLSLASCLLATFSFAQSVEIVYEKRPPYIEKKENTITGILGDVLINALDKAKITYTIHEKPSKRHLHEIKANRSVLCAVGWFKNPEREKFAKYTKPLYQDKPMGILTRTNHPLIKENLTIDQLLSNKSLIILGKKSYSYGKFIDEKIKEYNNKKRDVNSDNITMLKLIEKKRADFMFISYEEATSLLKEYSNKDALQFVALKEMPEGNKRYLICSKKTDDTIINLINKNL